MNVIVLCRPGDVAWSTGDDVTSNQYDAYDHPQAVYPSTAGRYPASGNYASNIGTAERQPMVGGESQTFFSESLSSERRWVHHPLYGSPDVSDDAAYAEHFRKIQQNQIIAANKYSSTIATDVPPAEMLQQPTVARRLDMNAAVLFGSDEHNLGDSRGFAGRMHNRGVGMFSGDVLTEHTYASTATTSMEQQRSFERLSDPFSSNLYTQFAPQMNDPEQKFQTYDRTDEKFRPTNWSSQSSDVSSRLAFSSVQEIKPIELPPGESSSQRSSHPSFDVYRQLTSFVSPTMPSASVKQLSSDRGISGGGFAKTSAAPTSDTSALPLHIQRHLLANILASELLQYSLMSSNPAAFLPKYSPLLQGRPQQPVAAPTLYGRPMPRSASPFDKTSTTYGGVQQAPGFRYPR